MAKDEMNHDSLLPKSNVGSSKVASQEISITMPYSLSKSLDYFLKHGYPSSEAYGWSGIDANKASLIRILISAYGFQQSNLAMAVDAALWRKDRRHAYISLRTANKFVINNPSSRVYRLVCAMVFRDIPIYRYDPKTGKQIGMYFNLRKKLEYAKSHHRDY